MTVPVMQVVTHQLAQSQEKVTQLEAAVRKAEQAEATARAEAEAAVLEGTSQMADL